MLQLILIVTLSAPLIRSNIVSTFFINNKNFFNLNTSNWSNATVISDDYTRWNNGSSFGPKIAIDKAGVIHVVWYDDTNGTWGTDTEIMYANYTTAGWSNATVISDNTGWNDNYSRSPDIAIDQNNVIHVVWYDNTDGEWGTDAEIMYANYTDSGWSNATVISDNTGWNNNYSSGPAIAIDKEGALHVVWWDDTDGIWGTDYEIMYANYTASGWSNATVISDNTGWNTGGSWAPDIAIDKNGVIHVVWEDNTIGEWGNDLEIMYTNYTASGWSNATVISDNTGWNNDSSSYPNIAIDKNGNLHVVWGDQTNGEWGMDAEIMYTKYTASGWSNATVISDNTGWNDGDSLYPTIAIDKNGILHVVWDDPTNGKWGIDRDVMYTNYTSLGWSNATVISDDDTNWNNGSSGVPDIKIHNNRICIVWGDDTDGEWGNDWEIMYTNKTIPETEEINLEIFLLAMMAGDTGGLLGIKTEIWIIIGIASIIVLIIVILTSRRK